MCKYIKEDGTVDEHGVNALISRTMNCGSMILMYTNGFRCAPLGEIEDCAHLLEVRVFHETAELKIMRPTIGDMFHYRLIDDTSLTVEQYIDEDHYLDIDEKRSVDNSYTATGGGTYTLPVANAKKIRIRNYLIYDEQGIAQITDFRAVKYLGGESDG